MNAYHVQYIFNRVLFLGYIMSQLLATGESWWLVSSVMIASLLQSMTGFAVVGSAVVYLIYLSLLLALHLSFITTLVCL